MSAAATLRPASLTFVAPLNRVYGHPADDAASTQSWRHDANYRALDRMLVRYQHLILLRPSPVNGTDALEDSNPELSPLQRRIHAELYSPFPYHRTKWLHNVQGARNLLLQLERRAHGIQVQRTKREMLKDLSDKRAVIKRLRIRVEEIGREVEGDNRQHRAEEEDAELLGDPVEDIVGDVLTRDEEKKFHQDNKSGTRRQNDRDPDGQPVKVIERGDADDGDDTYDTYDPYDYDSGGKDHDVHAKQQRHEAFDSSVRNRRGHDQAHQPTWREHDSDRANRGKTSGYSNLASTEKDLSASSRTHEDLTGSLVRMAAQLKQQTKAFEFTLDQDKTLVDRALEGLDRNVSAMDLASRNMAFLKRMSEGQGLWGRLKLYAIIFAMWLFAILLVFVLPKLRF